MTDNRGGQWIGYIFMFFFSYICSHTVAIDLSRKIQLKNPLQPITSTENRQF